MRNYDSLLMTLFWAHLSLSAAQDNFQWQDVYKQDYSYDPSASNGPDSWGSVEELGVWGTTYENEFISTWGNMCASGARPSPLHLEASELAPCSDVHELLTRQISDVDCDRHDLTFDITPYSLRASFPLTNETCLSPTLTASGRFDDFSLMWMDLRARSEHVVEGKRYDAELQMIHAGTGLEKGQLLTVSLLLEATSSTDDLELEWLLQQWEKVAEQEVEDCSRRVRRRMGDVSGYTSHKHSDNDASIAENQRNLQSSTPSSCQTDRWGGGCEPDGPRKRMFPYNMWQSIWYYGYYGSLTTPPCTPVVQWYILEEPRRISRRQYKRLTNLLKQSRDATCQADSAVDARTGDSFRPIQTRDVTYQHIYRCTFDDFGYYVYPPEQQ